MNVTRSLNVSSLGSKIILGLALAVMFGSLDVAPAFADRGDDRHDNGRYEKRGRGHDDRGYYRDHRGRRVYRTTTVYREQRVYVPPPVYYEPPPPAGINLFLPSIHIR